MSDLIFPDPPEHDDVPGPVRDWVQTQSGLYIPKN